MATNVTSHLLYSEYGADMTGSSVCYDEATKILVYALIKLQYPLNNHSTVEVFVHHHGDPSPKPSPDFQVTPLYKGESLSICKEETGLRVVVNGHNTSPDPNPHPPGSRLTTLETFVIPNVFV